MRLPASGRCAIPPMVDPVGMAAVPPFNGAPKRPCALAGMAGPAPKANADEAWGTARGALAVLLPNENAPNGDGCCGGGEPNEKAAVAGATCGAPKANEE